jgi:hypothetical protein
MLYRLLHLCAYTSLYLLSSYCYICVLIPRYLCRQVNEFNYNSTVDQIVLNSTTVAVLQGGQVEATSVCGLELLVYAALSY